MGSLEAYEKRMNKFSDQSLEQALLSKVNFRKETKARSEDSRGESSQKKISMKGDQIPINHRKILKVVDKEEETINEVMKNLTCSAMFAKNLAMQVKIIDLNALDAINSITFIKIAGTKKNNNNEANLLEATFSSNQLFYTQLFSKYLVCR